MSEDCSICQHYKATAVCAATAQLRMCFHLFNNMVFLQIARDEGLDFMTKDS